MNILVLEEGFGSNIHAKPISQGLERIGHKVKYRQWLHSKFRQSTTFMSFWLNLLYRLDVKFRYGPISILANLYVFSLCLLWKPKLVFIYRGKAIYPSTIRAIKSNGCTVFGFNNDDPFSLKYPAKYWQIFHDSLLVYDHVFAYRPSNLARYRELNVSTSMLLPYYSKSVIFPIPQKSQSSYDVVFAGHYEDDGRDHVILNLLEQGVNLQVFGPNWQRSKLLPQIEKHLDFPITELNHIQYNNALNSAKIALVFLSSLNNDTYTRRCFEIPNTNAVMLAPYSDDLNNIFEENVHCLYYRNTQQIEHIIVKYLCTPDFLREVNQNAHLKIQNEGHNENARAETIVKTYEELH
ncbi:glycosyltransferase [Amylibacter sp.]|nr:glycosyltransferase [Amylibacter sp.]